MAISADPVSARASTLRSDHADARVEGARPALSNLKVKIFADGADRSGMLEMYAKPYISGFTTNPTLMRKAGIADYRAFAREILACISDRPISFEVFADDMAEMERQAREIATWGEHVYVKIPVTNTASAPTTDLVHRLSHNGVKVNVTALMTTAQVTSVTDALAGGAPAYVSVFAGRIADTGRDPVPIMSDAVSILRGAPRAELIWASPRELLNIFQADAIGCHVITVTNDTLKKLELIGKNLTEFSLDTVLMFHRDAVAAGFKI
jgi:transaldolase